MNKKFYFYLVIIFFFSSCASYFNKNINQEKTEDLSKNFEIPKDTFEKFKVVETAPVAPTPEAKIGAEKEKTAEADKKKTGVKPTPQPKKPVKVSPVPVATKVTIPADYPEDYKALDEQSKILWSKFKNYTHPDENVVIEVFFLGIKVGNLAVTNLAKVKIGDAEAFHLKGRFITEKFYESFYKIDDTLESFVSVNDFRPLRYSLLQRESGQNVDDLQFFDYEKIKTFHWYKRIKDGEERKNEIESYIPRYIQDSFSVIYFVRGLPLVKDDKYEIPVVNKGKLWLTKIYVVGDDEVKFNDQWVKAIKLKAENYLHETNEKKSSIDFWFSNDEHRKLLKFMAKVKIGSVEGKLNFYSPGKQ